MRTSEIVKLSLAFLVLFCAKILFTVVVIMFSKEYSASSFLSVVSTSWDSHYFVWIAEHGYPVGNFWTNPQADYYAYLPLYPALIAALSYLIHDVLVSAFLMSNIFYFLTLSAFYFVARTWMNSDRAVAVTFLFGLFPLFSTYGFFSYSDAVYLCFAIASWYFFSKQDNVRAGLLAGLAAATRAMGVLLTPIYFALILYTWWKNRLKFKKTMVFLFSPIIAYFLVSLYFFQLSGNPFAIVDAESTWGVTLSGPLNLLRLVNNLSLFIFPMQFQVSVSRLFYLSIFLIGSIALWKVSRQLTFYSLTFMLFIMNLSGQSVFSEPRYALAAWPVFLLLSKVKERWMVILLAVAELLLALQSIAYQITWFWT